MGIKQDMIDSGKKFYKFKLILLLSFVVDGLSIIQNITKNHLQYTPLAMPAHLWKNLWKELLYRQSVTYQLKS